MADDQITEILFGALNRLSPGNVGEGAQLMRL